MTDIHSSESRKLHNVRNQLSVIIGFCDLILAELTEQDPKYRDVAEMRKAASTAMSLLEGATEIR